MRLINKPDEARKHNSALSRVVQKPYENLGKEMCAVFALFCFNLRVSGERDHLFRIQCSDYKTMQAQAWGTAPAVTSRVMKRCKLNGNIQSLGDGGSAPKEYAY